MLCLVKCNTCPKLSDIEQKFFKRKLSEGPITVNNARHYNMFLLSIN